MNFFEHFAFLERLLSTRQRRDSVKPKNELIESINEPLRCLQRFVEGSFRV